MSCGKNDDSYHVLVWLSCLKGKMGKYLFTPLAITRCQASVKILYYRFPAPIKMSLSDCILCIVACSLHHDILDFARFLMFYIMQRIYTLYRYYRRVTVPCRLTLVMGCTRSHSFSITTGWSDGRPLVLQIKGESIES